MNVNEVNRSRQQIVSHLKKRLWVTHGKKVSHWSIRRIYVYIAISDVIKTMTMMQTLLLTNDVIDVESTIVTLVSEFFLNNIGDKSNCSVNLLKSVKIIQKFYCLLKQTKFLKLLKQLNKLKQEECRRIKIFKNQWIQIYSGNCNLLKRKTRFLLVFGRMILQISLGNV